MKKHLTGRSYRLAGDCHVFVSIFPSSFNIFSVFTVRLGPLPCTSRINTYVDDECLDGLKDPKFFPSHFPFSPCLAQDNPNIWITNYHSTRIWTTNIHKLYWNLNLQLVELYLLSPSHHHRTCFKDQERSKSFSRRSQIPSWISIKDPEQKEAFPKEKKYIAPSYRRKGSASGRKPT
jgi:hypothetical protein